MEDIKPIIAKNITALRQNARMTQSELAERLNYSDKAISKWERAESIPDITVLKTIADLFEVPLDYLVRAEHDELPAQAEKKDPAPVKRRNHIIITILSVLLVWFVATLVYVILDVIFPEAKLHLIAFIYAVPASLIVWLVMNSVWFKGRRNCVIISLLMWAVLGSLVLTLLLCRISAWQLLFLGVPGQIITVMWSKLQFRDRK